MAETIRYRPVILGEPPAAGEVWYIGENPDGSVFLRDAESSWRLQGALESVTVDYLPEYYLSLPGFHEQCRILSIREASGATRLDAGDELLRQIESLAKRGVEAAPALSRRGAAA